MKNFNILQPSLALVLSSYICVLGILLAILFYVHLHVHEWSGNSDMNGVF